MMTLVFPWGVFGKKANPSVALVLGGGSARGLSHIGFIKAMEEQGIPIDLLVGTSMGSIIAGIYAAGYSTDNMIHIFSTLDMASLLDIPIPPLGGVLDTAGLQLYLDKLLRGASFDELPIPFYSVVVNLGTGKEEALNKGKVSTAIQASMSIPGIFMPVEINGQHYVDGGLKNQVAANVAADKGADVIVAIYLEHDYQEPNFKDIINNLRMSLTAMMDGYVDIHTAMADVLVLPEVDFDSSMDYYRVPYFVTQGFKAGNEYAEQIKEAILAQDPSYKFIPYKQTGCSTGELNQMLREAELAAAALPKRFTMKTLLTYDGDYNFTKLGLKFTHGPLKLFGVGYRYGFDAQDGGHELFLYWGTEKTGGADLYLRLNPKRSKPSLGFSLRSPELNNYVAEAAYVTQGDRAWRLSLTNNSLLDLPRIVGGLSLQVYRLRTDGTNVPYSEKIILDLLPRFRVYPWEDKRFAMGAALIKPYLLTGASVGTKISKFEPTVSIRTGVGLDFQLMGLYPGTFFAGIQFDGTGKLKGKFELKLGDV